MPKDKIKGFGLAFKAMIDDIPSNWDEVAEKVNDMDEIVLDTSLLDGEAKSFEFGLAIMVLTQIGNKEWKHEHQEPHLPNR